MQREDYLIHMIAQVGRVLSRVRQLLIDGKITEAGEELEQAARKGGLDLPLVIALDTESLQPLLITGGEFDRPKCALFAALVYLEWQRQLAIGNLDRADRCAERALLLYALAYDGIITDHDARERVAELKAYFEADG